MKIRNISYAGIQEYYIPFNCSGKVPIDWHYSTKVILFSLSSIHCQFMNIGLLYSLLEEEENEPIFALIGALHVELEVVKVMHYGVISQFITISKGSY